KWGGFLEGFADFDPLFFKIAPRDAAAMDPQERLFLMAAWTACEDAGYTRQRLAAQHGSRVGVFVGITKTGFALHTPYRAAGGGVVRPSTSFSGAANRVSHLLDLHGPSMPVDTMCSSSLTAIHEACEHLRSGDCELALAGGVNLYLHASTYVELSASRMLSQDGRCKSFGKGGNGFVPGEGVGCVLLKPLSRALADGDRIHALIRSTAVNHGGRTNGFTVPNPSAQRDLVRAALDRAGIDARTVTCIEAHGTGTELGDPIEVTGLTQAFRADTPDVGFCALGSVKSSIGHLEAAAGIAGLTKVILQMKHGVLAPTLHAAEINPNIDLSGSPFVLPSEPIAWDTPRRIAGVSSFGAGGANAHVVVEAWPSPEFADTMGSRVPAKESPRIAAVSTKIVPIPLSARDPDRLKAYAARLLACIEARRAPARREIAPVVEKSNDIEAMVAAKIADLLAVAPEQIERDEPFDAIGIAPPHRIALRAWAEATFDIELESAALRGAGSIQEVAAALAPIVAVADAGRDGPAPHGAAHEPFELADLAYTLQIGREPMDARLGVEADSIETLAAGLRAYLDGRHDHPGLHVGRTQDHRDVMSALAGDEADLRALTGRWIEQGSFGRLLGLWVKGWPVDWMNLHGATRPRIVTLPTYPFARERYWVPGVGAQDDRGALAPIIEDVAGDTDALLNEAEALERALAPLIRSIVASVPPAAMTPQFLRWRQALDDLMLRFPGVLDNVTPAEAWSQWKAFKSSAPGGAGPSTQVALAETMLRALPDILIGAQAATAVMFPAGSLRLIEGVYRQNAVAARFNGVVAAAVAAEVGRRLSQQPDARLRILEIGAGSGGTSEAVFRALTPYRSAVAEYRFTDVSRAFLIRAEREFGAAAPYLATALFDVEKPLANQDIAPGRYDIVIAANVLHATADIRNTLAVVRATMAPKALLLINETSKATLFTHVTFGLLAGWWRFVDADLR
ncbi:MAG TPA: beta-ketoacyl synthase N-terminal-like domain-containing protein, partial [Xanthobacteraceae bacterium]